MLIRNHLNYRISASLRVESFRRLQAFSLNEVQNNGMYSFHEDSKSAIVLQYDIWNAWVVSIERMLLQMESDEKMSKILMGAIRQSAKDKYIEYLSVLEKETKIFHEDFIELHKETNLVLMKRFLHKIEKCKGKTQIDSIVYLTRCLETFLHSSLYELQEVDYMIFNYQQGTIRGPFISIDQQDLNDANNKGNSSAMARMKIYVKSFGIEKVEVKSYIDAPCNLELILDKISNLGVTVTKVIH